MKKEIAKVQKELNNQVIKLMDLIESTVDMCECTVDEALNDTNTTYFTLNGKRYRLSLERL
jgi:hypothetical protein